LKLEIRINTRNLPFFQIFCGRKDFMPHKKVFPPCDEKTWSGFAVLPQGISKSNEKEN
jgi:hypothetical protein